MAYVPAPFVNQNLPLPGTKATANPAPTGVPYNETETASDFNAVTQAIYDLRTAFNYYPSILTFGGDPTGTTDNSAAFTVAFSALSSGGTLFLPPGTYVITHNVTVPSNVTLAFIGSVVLVSTGVVLTINGAISAAPQTIFAWSGGASPATQPIVFGSNKTGPILPQWFGAVGDGVTDSSAAVNVCFASIPAAGGAFYFSSGNYLVTGPFSFGAVAVQIYGDEAMVSSQNFHSNLPVYWYPYITGTWLIFQGAANGFNIPTGATTRLGLRNIGLLGQGTGATTGINATNGGASEGFYNVCIANWNTGIAWNGEDSNFYNLRIIGCNTGFSMIGGTINCFYGLDVELCTLAFDATNSQLTSIFGGTLQGNTTALKISPGASASSNELYFKNIWLEDNTTAIEIVTAASAGSAITMCCFDGIRVAGDPDTVTITLGAGSAINGLSFKDCYFGTAVTIPAGISATWINSDAGGNLTANASTAIIDGGGFVSSGSALPLVSQAGITNATVGHLVAKYTATPSMSAIASGWGVGAAGTFTENACDLAGRGGIQSIPGSGTSSISAGTLLFTVNLGTAFSSNQFTIIIQVADTGSASQCPGQIYAVAASANSFNVYSTNTVTPSNSADSGFCVFQWHIIGVTGNNT